MLKRSIRKNMFFASATPLPVQSGIAQYVEGDVVDLYKESREVWTRILRRILGEEN